MEPMMVYLYARVSTDKQENGREAQVSRLEQWAQQNSLIPDGLFCDDGVSAFSVPLRDRPEGRKLWDLLAPGDTVVITKVDRAFRSWLDAAMTIETCQKLGIKLHVLDMPFDISTPHGEFGLSMVVAAARLESRLHGQRKREVYHHKRVSGLPYNQLRPFGWVSTKGKTGKLEGWAQCEEEREIGARILQLRADGMSFPKIALYLCREGVRKPRRRKDSSGYYHVQDVFLLARAASAGYPIVPREFWQGPDYEQRLREAKPHAPQI
jgi:DNA invertase Pin-like site-specific DNA recombinase